MRVLAGAGRRFWAAGSAAVLAGLVSGVASAAMVAVMNAALYRHGAGLGVLAAVFGALVLVKLLGGALARFLLNRFMLDAVVHLVRDLSRKVLGTPLRRLESLGFARIMTTLTEDVGTLAFAIQELPTTAVNLAVIAGCAAYLGWLSWRVLAGVVLFVVIGVIVYRVLVAAAAHWFRRAREAREALMSIFHALTGGTKELQLHRRRREAFLHGRLDAATSTLHEVSSAAVRVHLLAGTWTQLLFSALIGALLFVGPRFEGVSMQALTGYLFATLYLMTPVWAIIECWPIYARARVALHKIEELQLALGDATEPGADGEVVGDWRQLELDGVTFAYDAPEGGEGFVLGPIDLTLRRGEVVFVVGGNGSGKSTFVKLLTGLYMPLVGAIRLDGVGVTDRNRGWYREHFTAVFSDFFLFDRLLGLDGDGVDARAREWLRRLELDAKVEVRDGAFSTTALSQGQRKRLALLTALLEDRPIYVFDEWAADQDPHYRDIFYRRLLPELKARGKTVVVISHDERYYHLGDRVVKLDYGQVVGESVDTGRAAGVEGGA
jgi:putative ATP-binding cassette transporter